MDLSDGLHEFSNLDDRFRGVRDLDSRYWSACDLDGRSSMYPNDGQIPAKKIIEGTTGVMCVS
jgi:hypothetical protein